MSEITEHAYTGERWLTALAMALCVLLLAGWTWRTGQVERQGEGEVTILAHQERVEGGPKRPEWVPPLVAEAADRAWQAQFAPEFADLHQTIQESGAAGQTTLSTHVMSFREHLALVEVVTRDADGGHSYRQTRVYRRAQEQWQPADSAGAAWGPWQTLATEHISIRYRTIDAAAADAAAPQLDLLYQRLRRDFGLPTFSLTSTSGGAATTQPHILIEVATDALPQGYGVHYDFTSAQKHTITVRSPSLLSVPVEMTAAAVFHQSVVYPLASLVLTEVVEQHPADWKAGFHQQWGLIMYALPLWALWEAEGPLADGREAVVRWLYQNAQAKSVAARQASPAGHERLCRTYRIWYKSAGSMGVPLICSDTNAIAWPPSFYPALSTRLGQRSNTDPALAEDALGDPVALETIVEYVVAAYGRDQLPRLIAAMGEHASWQTVLPAVFGVSAAEFEAGWQAYLAEQYGYDTK